METRPDSVTSPDGRYMYYKLELPRYQLDPRAASVYLGGIAWERYGELRRQARLGSEAHIAFAEKGARLPVVILQPKKLRGEALVALLGQGRPALVLPIEIENQTDLVLWGSSKSVVLGQARGGQGLRRWIEDSRAAGGAHAVVVADVRRVPGDRRAIGEVYGIFECGAVRDQADTMGSNYATLERAVRHGWNIRAVYNELPRLLTPHLLGSRNGELRVFSYQFGGKSKSGLHRAGSPNNFRCMRVRELQDIAVVGGEWHTGEGKGTPQNCLDRIDVRHPRRAEEDEAA